MNEAARIRWGSVAVAGGVAALLSMLLVFLVVFGYAFKLGVEARGAPDPARIQAFAQSVALLGLAGGALAARAR